MEEIIKISELTATSNVEDCPDFILQASKNENGNAFSISFPLPPILDDGFELPNIAIGLYSSLNFVLDVGFPSRSYSWESSQIAIADPLVGWGHFTIEKKGKELLIDGGTNVENLETVLVQLLPELRKIREIIWSIYKDAATVYQIQPRQFEELIAELLTKKGYYNIQLTKQTRDGGYDMAALNSTNGIILKSLIECKRYKKENKIGIEIVRSFSEVIREQQANKGIIITTSFFTTDAIKKQRANSFTLDLKDFNAVISWVVDYVIST